jgi:hypothetical protein
MPGFVCGVAVGCTERQDLAEGVLQFVRLREQPAHEGAIIRGTESEVRSIYYIGEGRRLTNGEE